ncbi:MAG: electron transfer flavoprotein subunit alpha [Firmicutes bacterium]|nr:electron transfer flavoprotein subunit alpha [Bacillota bacterium]
MAVNISNACIGCEMCVATCPYGALSMGEDGKCDVDGDKCTECGECIDVCPVNALSLPSGEGTGTEQNSNPVKQFTGASASEVPGNIGEYKGVWVFIEHEKGVIAEVALELLGAGRELAEKLGVELAGVLLGDNVSGVVDTLFEYGADRVYLMDNKVFSNYRTEAYTGAFANLVQEHKPEIVLMGATTTGRDLAGAVATHMETGLTADCTNLDIDLQKRILLATRPAFGGNIMATIVNKEHRPQMATVRPKVMRMAQPVAGRKGILVEGKTRIRESELATKVLEVVKEKGDAVSLADAEIIVAGGRGLGDKKGFESICFGLAEAIGAQVGASRAAVEAGWIDQKYQVGQTGVTVAPKIYIALGISGAVQHLVGIRGSDIIISVNKDPDAPIFNESTYGIVGDVFEVVPLLERPLKDSLRKQGLVSSNQDLYNEDSQEVFASAGKI